jgi:hypothetical protein
MIVGHVTKRGWDVADLSNASVHGGIPGLVNMSMCTETPGNVHAKIGILQDKVI